MRADKPGTKPSILEADQGNGRWWIQVASATSITMRTATAKRLRLKAQGCFNLGVVSADHYQPGTGCASGHNRVAVESVIQFCTQGSRSGNLGCETEPLCGKA